MKKSTQHDPVGICSVTEMARKVGLSRARFHQLRKLSVFPEPVYSRRTKRGYYTPELQKKCIEIRNTGIDQNGEPVIFNTQRKPKSEEMVCQPDHRHDILTDTLAQAGVNVTSIAVKDAARLLYPDGLPECVTDRKVIQGFLFHFRNYRQNTVQLG